MDKILFDREIAQSCNGGGVCDVAGRHVGTFTSRGRSRSYWPQAGPMIVSPQSKRSDGGSEELISRPQARLDPLGSMKG